jgi:acyl-CoA thioesterase-1
MKNNIHISIILVLAMFCSLANAKTILIMGDSLSAGYGIQVQEGWAALLQKKLSDNDHSYDVVNESISGETTDGGLRRFPSILQRNNPDIIILELGANDGLRGFPLPIIQNNLTQLVSMGLAKGAKVLILGMHIPPNYGTHYTEKFHAIYQKIASEKNTALVSFFLEGIATNNDYMQADGLHPNAQGQPLILNNVWLQLEPLL